MQKGLRDGDIVPIGIGYYTVPEAARLLKTMPRNISRWLRGYSYKDAGGAVALSATAGEIVSADRLGLARETAGQFGSVARHHAASRSATRSTG